MKGEKKIILGRFEKKVRRVGFHSPITGGAYVGSREKRRQKSKNKRGKWNQGGYLLFLNTARGH